MRDTLFWQFIKEVLLFRDPEGGIIPNWMLGVFFYIGSIQTGIAIYRILENY